MRRRAAPPDAPETGAESRRRLADEPRHSIDLPFGFPWGRAARAGGAAAAAQRDAPASARHAARRAAGLAADLLARAARRLRPGARRTPRRTPRALRRDGGARSVLVPHHGVEHRSAIPPRARRL